MTCAVVACGGDTPASDATTATPEAAVTAVAAGGAYPALYTDLDLPVLPGGTVEDTGRQTTSLRDGLSIRLTTDMTVDEAREYYSTQLAAAGWEEVPGRELPGLPLAGVRASRDGVAFQAVITADGDQTRVQLSVNEP